MLLPQSSTNVVMPSSNGGTPTAVGEVVLTASVVSCARAGGSSVTKLRLYGTDNNDNSHLIIRNQNHHLHHYDNKSSFDNHEAFSFALNSIERDKLNIELLFRLDFCKRLREKLEELERYCAAVEALTVVSKQSSDLLRLESITTFDRFLSYIRKHINKDFPSALFHSLQDWRLHNLLQLREYLKMHPTMWEWSWSHRVINNCWLELMKKILLPSHRRELALAITYDLPIDFDRPPFQRILNSIDFLELNDHQQQHHQQQQLHYYFQHKGTLQHSASIGSLDSTLHRIIRQELAKHDELPTPTRHHHRLDESTDLVQQFDASVRLSDAASDSDSPSNLLRCLHHEVLQLKLSLSETDVLYLLQELQFDLDASKSALRHLQRVQSVQRGIRTIDVEWKRTEQSLIEQLSHIESGCQSLEEEESLVPLEALGSYLMRHYCNSFNLEIIWFLKNITLQPSEPSPPSLSLHLSSLRDFRLYLLQQPTLWSWRCWSEFGSPEERMVWFAVLQELLREDRRGDLLLAIKHNIPLDLNSSPVIKCILS
eukprot:TRINITY_DN5459_c0_g1_i1.p1 TRINITY_DN5459_c0_g1~~TRINITY_DN5459_c0_g1_i1.p1  ORF type:complete len:541 (-),score=114.33 TRINITY_DN5459_c0_g1_i1:124-1746(-)